MMVALSCTVHKQL